MFAAGFEARELRPAGHTALVLREAGYELNALYLGAEGTLGAAADPPAVGLADEGLALAEVLWALPPLINSFPPLLNARRSSALYSTTPTPLVTWSW